MPGKQPRRLLSGREPYPRQPPNNPFGVVLTIAIPKLLDPGCIKQLSDLLRTQEILFAAFFFEKVDRLGGVER